LIKKNNLNLYEIKETSNLELLEKYLNLDYDNFIVDDNNNFIVADNNNFIVATKVYVFSFIAQNINCSEDIFEKLYNEKDNFLNFIKCQMAENENCPIYILKKLSDLNNISINCLLSYNKNCPNNILKKIYKTFFNLKIEFINNILAHPNWNFGEFQ